MKTRDKISASVLYQLFLRPFTPEGTLSAAAGLLEHIRSLGVDVVYLCPVFRQDDDPRTEYWSDRQIKSGLKNPKNTYRIQDYFHVDPEYGTDGDLGDFIEKAHRLGLRVILDLVYYHCGPTAVFLEQHPDFIKRDANGTVHYGSWHFPELNFECQELREYLWGNMEFFVREYGVDGYRCDVGDMVPLSFWEEGRKRLAAIRPDLLMLNEGTKPEYLGTFDVNYDFRWSCDLPQVCAGGCTVQKLREYWEEVHNRLPAGGQVLRSMDNHDIANDTGICRRENAIGSRAVEACLTVNFTLDGVPFLYNGYEIADNGSHSIYGNRFYGKNFLINWSRALTAAGKERLEFIRGLCNLRHAQPALSDGDVEWLPVRGEGAAAYLRRSPEQTLAVLVNLRDEPASLWIPLADSTRTAAVLWQRSVSWRRGGEGLQADLGGYGFLVVEV